MKLEILKLKLRISNSKLGTSKGVALIMGLWVIAILSVTALELSFAMRTEKDPDWLWKLKGVVRPAGKKKAFYCRVFSEAQVAQAGVNVKDRISLDDHPDLILWEGSFDKETNTVRHEKFIKPSNSPN